jgi:hypothetical protein
MSEDLPPEDEWGACACAFDPDGLLVDVCATHALKMQLTERLLQDKLDRELDLRLHELFCRTNLTPAVGNRAPFPVQRRR